MRITNSLVTIVAELCGLAERFHIGKKQGNAKRTFVVVAVKMLFENARASDSKIPDWLEDAVESKFAESLVCAIIDVVCAKAFRSTAKFR